MLGWVDRRRFFLAALLCVFAAAAAAAPRASAQAFTDVPSGEWARGAINWVTNQGPAGDKALDDYGSQFEPDQAITRAQLARALVILAGHEGETVQPRAIPDMPSDVDAYYWDVQLALHYGYLSLTTKNGVRGFYPDSPMTDSGVETAIVRWARSANPDGDWSLLKTLKAGVWEPTPGWKPSVPSYFASVIASRQLRLRYNHPSGDDGLEVTPRQHVDRSEVAYMLRQASRAGSNLWVLPKYDHMSLPPMSSRQEAILQYAFKFIGYPYVWAGEWPTADSPYGYQAAGGFDCSGFTFYVMQCHFGYPVAGRGASDQARLAKPRIGRRSLKPGDLIFFGYNGTKSTVSQIYHAAIYMGNGWFIHSTGSSDGVTIDRLSEPYNDYWRAHFAWGRRLLSPAELTVG